MEVAVVILNYNGEKHLENFLPSVIEYSKESTIWVIDNCSTDESVNFLKSQYPQIKLLINEENGGFAKGYNDGLKKIKADYYVLLNSDIEVTPNWVQACIDVLESDSSIAALQPKILAYKNRGLFEHAGAGGGFIDKNFYPFCRGRIFDLVEKDSSQYDDNIETFWASGACLFIRANLYHEMGGLDEDFFAHMEEIDLCWRLKRRNHKIYYCGSSIVYHLGGGTLAYKNPKKTYLNFRNSLFMIYKNYEGPLFIKLFSRMFLDGAAALIFILKFQFSHFFAVFKAHMAFYANLKKLNSKRKLLKKTSTQYNSIGTYKGNIIFDKFLKGVKHFDELKTSYFQKK